MNSYSPGGAVSESTRADSSPTRHAELEASSTPSRQPADTRSELSSGQCPSGDRAAVTRMSSGSAGSWRFAERRVRRLDCPQRTDDDWQDRPVTREVLAHKARPGSIPLHERGRCRVHRRASCAPAGERGAGDKRARVSVARAPRGTGRRRAQLGAVHRRNDGRAQAAAQVGRQWLAVLWVPRSQPGIKRLPRTSRHPRRIRSSSTRSMFLTYAWAWRSPGSRRGRCRRAGRRSAGR